MAIIESPLARQHIPTDRSVTDFVLGRAAKHATHHSALIDGITGQRITYGELRHVIRRCANALWRRGLRQGHVVCIVLPNCVEYPVIVHGALLVGATVTACNPLFTQEEISAQLKDSNARVVFTTVQDVTKVTAAMEQAGIPTNIYVRGELPGYFSVKTLFENEDETLPEVVVRSRRDVAFLLYSSGTTGMPKGVMLSHYNIIACVCQFSHPAVGLGAEDGVYLGVAPFFHAYGLNVVLHTGLYLGVTIVTLPRFTPDTYMNSIEKHQVSLLHVAPPTAIFLAKSPLVAGYDTSSVHTIFSGGAPLSEEIGQTVKKRLNARSVRQGYGMTEASPGILIGLPASQQYGSVGVVMSNTEVKVLDLRSSACLSANKSGEIWARGPQVMLGYHQNQQATSASLDNEGWLRTGDTGYYDEDGRFYIVDRIKELIKYKGYQVAPAELEAVLLRHPAVVDAAVVGTPDTMAGELPTAFVVTSRNVGKEELMAFVSERVAPYKRVSGGVLFVDVIPKSPSGKILRRLLRERLKVKSRL